MDGDAPLRAIKSVLQRLGVEVERTSDELALSAVRAGTFDAVMIPSGIAGERGMATAAVLRFTEAIAADRILLVPDSLDADLAREDADALRGLAALVG